MPYTIEALRAAEKFLDELIRQQPSDAAAIEDTIEDLAADPHPHGCTALKGYRDVWRVHVGDYRVCYRVDDGKLLVLVVIISTRDDVYQALRRVVGR